MRSVLFGVLGLVASCGVHHGGSDGGVTYDSLDVEPAQVTLNVMLDGTATQAYQVFGTVNGVQTDISAQCGVTLDPAFGLAAGTTIKVGPHGGTTTVTAVCGLQSGTSALTVNLSGTLVVGTNTPANAPALFGAATTGTDTTHLPSIEYPIDQAIAPLNIPAIEIQYTTANNDLFHISLTSTNAAIDVYSSDPQVQLGDVDWAAITSTSAGGTLTVAVEGLLQAAPTMKYPSAPISIALSHDTIDMSALYYWASSQGSIMTETFGQTTPPTVVKDNCTACHSLSRAGTRLGYSRCVAGVCGPEYTGFMHYDPISGWNEVVDADNKAIEGTYSTFAPPGNPFPDDSKSVALVTSYATGALNLYDPDSGTAVTSNAGVVSTHGPNAPRSALMPDWSADGNTIVFASVSGSGHNVDLDGGAIATMSYQYTPGGPNGDHTFGEPSFLVTPPLTLPTGTYENLFFPSFSPDGALVVFNAARASWRNFGVAAQSGQRLMLASADGTGVVDLSAMNGGNVDLDTTWPHWAPGNTSDYYWVVFSSERNYGHEVTATNTNHTCVANGVQQCKQIWIGAIDKTKLAAGLPIDPSAAPMWLPGQDTQADNISPYWTVPTPLQ